MIKICFVCTGNTCRSIMAERLLKKYLKDNNLKDVKVSSRGLRARGENIADNAKITLKKLKASASNRKSVKLGKVDKDTLYIVMNDYMKEEINSQKIITMKSLIGEDIIDPYGYDEQVYMLTAKKIMKANEVLISKINLWRGL